MIIKTYKLLLCDSSFVVYTIRQARDIAYCLYSILFPFFLKKLGNVSILLTSKIRSHIDMTWRWSGVGLSCSYISIFWYVHILVWVCFFFTFSLDEWVLLHRSWLLFYTRPFIYLLFSYYFHTFSIDIYSYSFVLYFCDYLI